MTFETSAIERLSGFLSVHGDSSSIETLTPDASTREFFRVPWNEGTAIACVYPHTIDDSLPQIDVTRLLLSCGIPVAHIFQIEGESGIIVHEDFGDNILRDLIGSNPEGEHYIDLAIGLIGRIQACTEKAVETGSISSHLKFDLEKLVWELEFFLTHYFGSYRKTPPSSSIERELKREFEELACELETFASVLTHRDFHAANLMVDKGQLRVIDHQDARIGSPCYDLVSLLLDRIEVQPPEEYLSSKKMLLQKEREALGLRQIPEIDYQFDLVTVQRCLKAIGTFANQAANFNKPSYLKYIEPMFRAVLNTCTRLGRFENITEMIENELQKSER